MKTEKTSIKEWCVEDRPREKSLEKGFMALSDAEILAILLGSGTQKLSAVDLARNILKNYSLNDLARSSVQELTKIPGIGVAKATTILAAFEFGRRKERSELKKCKFTSPEIVGNYLKAKLQDLNHEQFWAIFLNNQNQILQETLISKGGISATLIDHRLIFKYAFECTATGMIVCHNHPSGKLEPSDSDIKVTNKLVEISKLMEINFLDHIVVSREGYFSFRENDLM